jgi:hypothetical protein
MSEIDVAGRVRLSIAADPAAFVQAAADLSDWPIRCPVILDVGTQQPIAQVVDYIRANGTHLRWRVEGTRPEIAIAWTEVLTGLIGREFWATQ